MTNSDFDFGSGGHFNNEGSLKFAIFLDSLIIEATK
jgi:hypothetical protein